MPTVPEIDARNPLADDCRRCPALVEGRECLSWGNGPLDAGVVVVGEAPATATPTPSAGRAVTGPVWPTPPVSGRRIRALLAETSIEDA